MGRAVGTTRKNRFTVEAPEWTLLHEETFDAMTLSDPMTLAQGRQWLDDSNIGGSTTFNCFDVITRGAGKAGSWHSPAGTFGTGDGIGLGANVDDPFASYIATNGIILRARLDFDVMFPADMDWSKGGKLFGLGGAESGQTPPSGCPGAGTYTGFSARLMFWPNGRLNSYRYHPNFGGSCGEDRQSSFFFTPGQWHSVSHEVEMNTVTGGTGNPDGVDRVTVDGNTVILDEDMVWRELSTIGVTHQCVSAFRGGSDITWAGSVDNDIAFDNYRIYVAS